MMVRDRPLPEDRRPQVTGLPSETSALFLLLVAMLLGSALFVFDVVGLHDVQDPHRFAHAVVECSDARRTDLAQCVAAHNRAVTGFVLAAVGVAAAMTVFGYLMAPALRRWWRGLEPVPCRHQKMLRELDRLAAVAGVAPPRWVWAPAARPPTSAVAFGRWGRREVSVPAYLRVVWGRDPAAFRAVVLHELGHLREGDVDRLYLTASAWWVFVGLVLLPWALTLPGEPVAFVAAAALRVAALTGFVLVVRNGLVRIREFAADARAASWAGPGAIRQMVRGLRQRGIVSRLVGYHPSPTARERAVDEPERLLRARPDLMGVAGVALGVVTESLTNTLLTAELTPLTTQWLSVTPGACLVAAVVVVLVWRATLAAPAGRLPARTVTAGGLALGVGTALGRRLALWSGVPGTIPAMRTSDTTLVQEIVLVAASLTFVAWTGWTASAWLAGRSARTRRRTCLTAAVAAGAMLTALLVWTEPVRDMPDAFRALLDHELSDSHDRAATILTTGPLWLWRMLDGPDMRLLTDSTPAVMAAVSVAVVVALWAVPMLRPRRWPLDGVRAGPRPGRRGPMSAAAAGGLGGLVVSVAWLTFRAVVHAQVPLAARLTTSFADAVSLWMVAITTGGQLATAAVVTLRARDRAVPTALAATTFVGLIAAVAVEAAGSLGSCVTALSLRPSTGCHLMFSGPGLLHTVTWFLVEGTLFSLPTIAVATAVASSWPRLKGRLMRRGCIAVIVIVTLLTLSGCTTGWRRDDHPRSPTPAAGDHRLALIAADLPAGWSSRPPAKLETDLGRLALAMLSECFQGPDPATLPAERSPTFIAPGPEVRHAFSITITMDTAADATAMVDGIAREGARCHREVEDLTAVAGIRNLAVEPLNWPDQHTPAFHAEQLHDTPAGEQHQHIDYVAMAAGQQFALVSFESLNTPFPATTAREAVAALTARTRP